MKISIIGPGLMPIPPKGWGAVETLIWDYKETLEKKGVDVQIVNTQDRDQIINSVNDFKPDFIHIQYDDHWSLDNLFDCKNIAITTHYGYTDQLKNRPSDNYLSFFNGIVRSKILKLFSLSPSISKAYIDAGFPAKRVFLTPNGVRDDKFVYKENPDRGDLSIYLAKIDYRKRQHLFSSIPNLMFAGNIADGRFVANNNYLGELSRDYLYKHLTKFGNLVLLSDGEAHSLVCLEALCTGLGLVISEYACANLDLTKPFITVIPENKIQDIEYVSKKIEENRKVSTSMRSQIRKYAIDNFSYTKIVDNYLKCIVS